MRWFDRASIAEEYVTVVGARRQGKTTLAIDLARPRNVLAVMCGTEADHGVWKGVVPFWTPVLSHFDADLMGFCRSRGGGCVVVDGIMSHRGIGTAAVHTYHYAIDPLQYGRFVFVFRNDKPSVLYHRSGAHTWVSYSDFKRAHDQATATPFTALVIDTAGRELKRYRAEPLGCWA